MVHLLLGCKLKGSNGPATMFMDRHMHHRRWSSVRSSGCAQLLSRWRQSGCLSISLKAVQHTRHELVPQQAELYCWSPAHRRLTCL
jgi:hypothetical protein